MFYAICLSEYLNVLKDRWIELSRSSIKVIDVCHFELDFVANSQLVTIVVVVVLFLLALLRRNKMLFAPGAQAS